MRRIARGVWKYVIATDRPFLVGSTAPYFIQRYGERPRQEPRTRPATEPLQIVVPTGNGANLVAAHLTKLKTRSVGQEADDPIATVLPGGDSGVVAAFLAQHNGGMVGHDARKPVSTIVETGSTQAIVAVNLCHQYGSATNGGQGDPTEPLKTVTTGGHHALVASFLTKYYGHGGQWQDPRQPLHTVTARARMSAVLVQIGPVDFVINDIGMRMLTARELFRAQGFPETYVIDPPVDGKPMNKTRQIAMCGNSVCPDVARALVRANMPTEHADRECVA